MKLEDLLYTSGHVFTVDWREILGINYEGFNAYETVDRSTVAEAMGIPEALLEKAGLPETLVGSCGLVDLSEYEDEIENTLEEAAVDTYLDYTVEVNSLEGPMMNYVYPLPDFKGDEQDAAILPGCVCLVHFGDDNQDRGLPEWGLALTGGGMDLSWEISLAYVRLGFIPPAGVVNRLPLFAGKTLTDEAVLVVNAITKEAEGEVRRAQHTIQEMDRIKEWYAEEAKRGAR